MRRPSAKSTRGAGRREVRFATVAGSRPTGDECPSPLQTRIDRQSRFVAKTESPDAAKDLAAACARGDFRGRAPHSQPPAASHEPNFVESNRIPVKASLALLGLCDESFRLPLVPPTDGTREALRSSLRELGLLA